jgi:hypothetical protein
MLVDQISDRQRQRDKRRTVGAAIFGVISSMMGRLGHA